MSLEAQDSSTIKENKMDSETETEASQAEYGEKTIGLRIYFFTSNLAEGKDQVIPKHARAKGMVAMERNKAHNIHPKKPKSFNSLMELPSVIEKVLLEHGISIYASPKMRKYLTTIKPTAKRKQK